MRILRKGIFVYGLLLLSGILWVPVLLAMFICKQKLSAMTSEKWTQYLQNLTPVALWTRFFIAYGIAWTGFCAWVRGRISQTMRPWLVMAFLLGWIRTVWKIAVHHTEIERHTQIERMQKSEDK